METFGSYMARTIQSGGTINPTELQEIMQNQANSLGFDVKVTVEIPQALDLSEEISCRVCGFTESDCSQCIEKDGYPCHWVEDDLCSSCQ